MIQVEKSKYMDVIIKDFAQKAAKYIVSPYDFGACQDIVLEHETGRIIEEVSRIMKIREDNMVEMDKLDREKNISGRYPKK